MNLQARPLSYTLGAQVIGLDFSRRIDETSVQWLRETFLKYSILLFRGQSITREQHVKLSEWFGEVESNEAAPKQRLDGHPKVLTVEHRPRSDYKPTDYYNGMFWHTDHSHTLKPARATTLHAIEIPEVGGDTMFSNMYAAYDALSNAMKKMLDGLYAVHPVGTYTRRIDRSSPEAFAASMKKHPPIAQPLVREHPESRRKALYLSEKVRLIDGLTAEESQPILDFLCRHSTRPQFVYRHRWQKDDLLVWDNCCLMHLAVNDFDKSQRRYMERTVVNGPASGYAYEGAVPSWTNL
jgi:taurine dioxygenase